MASFLHDAMIWHFLFSGICRNEKKFVAFVEVAFLRLLLGNGQNSEDAESEKNENINLLYLSLMCLCVRECVP